ncbi:MAG: MarR family transcriptional regulator [Dactylosporangium sp.]|nr:MarR family transcriptional regulator [Dactylosporangium sp.]
MTERLPEQRERGWRAYIEASLRLITRLEEDLRPTGLSLADYHVLVLLSEAPDRRLRMGELADRLVFSPSRLTYHISSMEKRGLVRRESCPQDRRGSHAVLTGHGLEVLRAAAPHHLDSVRRHFLDDLDDAEVAYLDRVFTRLGQRLRGSDRALAR